jgi:hypothetical protein
MTGVLRRLATGALAALVALAGVPALAQPDEGAAVDRSAGYLVGGLTGGTHVETTVEGQVFVDYGRTADIAYALLASGRRPQVLSDILDYLSAKDNVDAYTHGSTPDSNYAGATAKLALLLALAGRDPRQAGGYDLVTELAGLQGADGRFADRSQYGNYANTFSQSYGVLALTAAGERAAADKAATALAAAGCQDGTVPVNFPPANGCATGTADATGLAVQALNASTGASELPDTRLAALIKAVHALEASRDASGAWTGPGGLNVNSTGFAVMGMIGAKLAVLPSRQWLGTVQGADGGFPINPGQPSDGLATAQALPAFAGKSLLTTGSPLLRPAVAVTPADPTPSPTGDPSTPASTTESPITETPATSADDTTAVAETPLARTGAPVTELALGALLLVVGGAAMVSGTRRRRARP